MSMSNYQFAITVAQAMKNTDFSHPFPLESASGFVFQILCRISLISIYFLRPEKFDISSVDCIS